MSFDIENGILKKYQAEANETEITIPDSVTRIGEHAFEGCSSLVSVSVPDSVTSIGALAFANCKELSCITLPNNLQDLGINFSQTSPMYYSKDAISPDAFIGCTKLKKVFWRGNIIRYDAKTFKDCGDMEHIVGDRILSPSDALLENFNSLCKRDCPDDKRRVCALLRSKKWFDVCRGSSLVFNEEAEKRTWVLKLTKNFTTDYLDVGCKCDEWDVDTYCCEIPTDISNEESFSYACSHPEKWIYTTEHFEDRYT